MTMTPEAKRALSQTIRELRAKLLTDLKAATESTYRLGARSTEAGLSEQAAIRRLEDWVDEQGRAQPKKNPRNRDDFFREAEKQAAYTLLNRLILLRLLESSADSKPIRKIPVLTGGWDSKGYKDFRAPRPTSLVLWASQPQKTSSGVAFGPPRQDLLVSSQKPVIFDACEGLEPPPEGFDSCFVFWGFLDFYGYFSLASCFYSINDESHKKFFFSCHYGLASSSSSAPFPPAEEEEDLNRSK